MILKCFNLGKSVGGVLFLVALLATQPALAAKVTKGEKCDQLGHSVETPCQPVGDVSSDQWERYDAWKGIYAYNCTSGINNEHCCEEWVSLGVRKVYTNVPQNQRNANQACNRREAWQNGIQDDSCFWWRDIPGVATCD